mmetsp:Transcript_16763/g.30957  ORF Transcript_16763/g.30957 Transcript_16763/m.30957 type:complete len:134 (-) Transcript_16763:70-471(-)
MWKDDSNHSECSDDGDACSVDSTESTLKSKQASTQDTSANCGNCGYQLRANFRFCTECGHKVGALKAPTPLKASAPVFIPASEANYSTYTPEINDVLHGFVEDIAPGLMSEMKKSSKLCESLLLQAMPDHYDD